MMTKIDSFIKLMHNNYAIYLFRFLFNYNYGIDSDRCSGKKMSGNILNIIILLIAYGDAFMIIQYSHGVRHINFAQLEIINKNNAICHCLERNSPFSLQIFVIFNFKFVYCTITIVSVVILCYIQIVLYHTDTYPTFVELLLNFSLNNCLWAWLR